METILLEKRIPVKYDTELIIAGGGPAGIAAGITAARKGINVIILEGEWALGGAGTVGMVPAFMQFGDGVNLLSAGIGFEIYERLKEAGGTGQYLKMGINTEVLKRVYEEMTLKAGASFVYGSKIIGVKREHNNITHIIVASKSGIYAAKAKVFIDCTGDGDLCSMADVPFEVGGDNNEMMPGTLCSFWTDIDWNKYKDGHNGAPQDAYLEQAFKENIFKVHDYHLAGFTQTAPTSGGGNIGHAFGVDPLNEESLTKAFVEQRKRLLEYQEYYRKYICGCERMELGATGSVMGVRESRRIRGDYQLNIQDFKNRAVFEDEIGRYCYPVDIHASTPDVEGFKQFEREFKKEFRYEKGESYGIPYRILTPVGLDNTLMAGRCISCDRYMMGSIRVMPGCYITGQAAGMAAAMAVRENLKTRAIDIGKLQGNLVDIGAYLPNYAAPMSVS